MGRIFCRIGRQTIFQVGVVSTDVDCAVGFVKPYLGQFVFLLDSCNHFEFHLISDRMCKRPVFSGKSPVQDRQNSRIFNGNAADDAEAVQRFRKRNSAKIRGLDRKVAFPTNRRNHGCKTELFLEKFADCLPFSPNVVFLCLPRNLTAALFCLPPSGRSWQNHIPFGRSFSFQFAPQLVGSEKGCKLTPSIINWELFCRLHERIFVNFL